MKRFLAEITILTLVASILIFYKFNQIPKNLSYDEVEFAKLAISLDKKPYTPFSSLATGHSTLYFYIILLSFKIFGINNFALRFPSALFGVLNVLLFYFIIKVSMKEYGNIAIKKWFPFILSLIFLTSRWYFNFARFSFEATFLLFLELASVYFLFQYLKKRESTGLLLATVFAGLTFNSYTPGRIFFIIPLVFIVWRVIKQWSSGTTSNVAGATKQLSLGLFIFLLTVLPLTSYLFTHPDIRFQQQFFINNSNESIHRKAEFLWSNIKSTVLMFNLKGDVNGRHNYPFKPALNSVLGVFFLGGLFLTLKNYKNFYNQFFLLYFVISLIPSILTYPWENPNMLRTFTVIPSVVFFAGRAVEFLMGLNLKKTYKKYLVFFILFLLVSSSIYEIRTYFRYQSKVFEQAFEVKQDLETVLK